MELGILSPKSILGRLNIGQSEADTITLQMPDANVLMSETIEFARLARRLAQQGQNTVAVSSADNFEQGAANAYRNRNTEQLQANWLAAKTLYEALQNPAAAH